MCLLVFPGGTVAEFLSVSVKNAEILNSHGDWFYFEIN